MSETKKMICEHNWKNDPMFEDGTVIMDFGTIDDMRQEMRQWCEKCGEVRYIKK